MARSRMIRPEFWSDEKGFLNSMTRMKNGRGTYRWGFYYLFKCRCGNHHLREWKEFKHEKEK